MKHRPAQPFNASYLQLSTLTLWSSCLLIGALGIAIPYARPRPPAPEPAPVHAEVLHVELSNEALPMMADQQPSMNLSTPPPAMTMPAAPSVPAMTAVAQPSASIAFAVPVEGPVRIVEKAETSYSRVVEPQPVVQAAAAPVQALTFGQGEGRQPAPEYPYKAMREGQQGSVKVLFTVDESGRVLTAEASTPSPWAMLNAAAVKAVKERWRFRSGPVRTFEVSIRFQL
ncbi:MAG: energy transducer TonB [Verrucomicrobiales bacterium]